MRLLLPLTLSAAVNAFVPQSTRSNHKSSSPSTLEARRSILPIIRRNRPSLRFPDFESLFDEIDQMMDRSVNSILTPTPSLFGNDEETSIIQRDIMKLRRPLGLQVTQDDNQYKVTMHVPDVEVENLDLQLDHDGRVLRLKGERSHEDEGMKLQSRFEKAVLLSPDIDTTKLAANMSGDILTIVAPKIESKEVLKRSNCTKIEIQFEQPEMLSSGIYEETRENDDVETAKAQVSVESVTNENPDVSNDHKVIPGEKKWPVKDFPY